MKKVTLKEQLEKFESEGIILDSDGQQSNCYGFYDWFCKDTSLKSKGTSLMKKTSTFVKKMGIDTTTHYVFFKNNCPMNGPLYDDFRICDIETGDVMWNVTPKSGHSLEAEVYSSKHGFSEPLFAGKTLNEIYSKMKNN